MDQASELRNLKSKALKNAINPNSSTALKITAITGGKGGVGKSNIALNLALALSYLNEKLCLMDADLGLANIDILLGIKPKFNIAHVFSGQRTLSEILLNGPNSLKIIPASSGIKHMAELPEDTLKMFTEQARMLGKDFDRLIIDTPAGISRNVMTFLLASNEVVVIATPEPTSLTDSYALLKSYKLEGGKAKIMILMNMCKTEEEGFRVGNRLRQICRQFLGIMPELLGVINQDNHVGYAIRKQKAFFELFNSSIPARQIQKIAEKLKQINSSQNDLGTFFSEMRGFIT